jgi:hypothetical protein
MAGSWLGELIGAGVGEAIGKAATPFTDAWIKTRESAALSHKVDKETDAQITIASFQTDQRTSELQLLLAQADRADWRTAWIRPVGAAVALYVFACVAIEHSMPKLAKLLWIETSEMPMPWGYIAGGILCAIFVLRSVEKTRQASNVTTAHANIAKAQAAILKREDAQ